MTWTREAAAQVRGPVLYLVGWPDLTLKVGWSSDLISRMKEYKPFSRARNCPGAVLLDVYAARDAKQARDVERSIKHVWARIAENRGTYLKGEEYLCAARDYDDPSGYRPETLDAMNEAVCTFHAHAGFRGENLRLLTPNGPCGECLLDDCHCPECCDGDHPCVECGMTCCGSYA